MLQFTVALIALLVSLPAGAGQDGAYLHWNIDHTQRTPRPAHPLTPAETTIVDHYVLTHDREGRLATVTFMHNGRPAAGGEHGVATVEFIYGQDKTTEQYRDADGKPTSSRSTFRKIYHHAGGGFWTRVSFENEDGSLAQLSGGYNEIRVERDDAGRVVRETRHAEDGTIVPEHNGFQHASFVYDERDFARYRQYLDSAGRLKNGALGYARVAFKFDEHGNFLEEHAEDETGAPATLSAGFHRIEWREFNRHELPARVYYFGPRGYVYKPYAYSVRDYLPSTQRKRIAFFGPTGEPVMHPQGFHSISFDYAEDGSVQSRTRFDTAGKPIE